MARKVKRLFNQITNQVSSHTEPRNDTSSASASLTSTSTQGSTSGVIKKVRSKTRGLNSEKVQTQLGTKIPITLSEELKAPTGPYASMFANDICFTIRTHAPLLDMDQWSDDIDDTVVQKLVERITSKYDIDMLVTHVHRYIHTNFQARYCDFRHQLKLHFDQYPTVEEAKKHKHKEISTQEEWDFLCSRFSSDKFQERSKKNTENRSNLTYNHKGGSKSFVAHQEEIAAQMGEKRNAIDKFEKLHKNSKNGWDIGAKAKWDEMIGLRDETTLPDGTRTMTDDEIVAKVLGVKSGYIKGCGFGPQPSGSYSKASMAQKNKELEDQLKGTRDQLQETQLTVETQQQELDQQRQVIAQLVENQKRFHEFMEKMNAG